MKVKMLETYQGVGHTAILLHEGLIVSVLEAGESYEVNSTLGAWLVENRKAEEIKSLHYGAQEQPEFRADDEKYKEMTAEPEGEPLMSTKSQSSETPKRGRRSK